MAVATLAAAIVACAKTQENDGYSGVMRFDSTSIRVVTASGTTTTLRVELAQTPEQRTMGLMERESLPDSAGMLFLYDRDQPDSAGFWMFRTRIPLDIAFIDSAGRIVAIRQMAPCPATIISGCPSYEPGAPYRAALEVNAGVLSRHGIGPGARVELPGKRN